MLSFALSVLVSKLKLNSTFEFAFINVLFYFFCNLIVIYY